MPARTFTGPDGTAWQAWDVIPGQHADWPAHARTHLPEALGDGWLCFESAGEKRRLHPIPQAWEHISDVELWSICSLAQPVLRRVPTPTAGG